MKRFWALSLLLLMSTHAYAVVPIAELNLFYLSDTMSYSSADSKFARTFYDLLVGFDLNKGGSFSIGWNYSNMSFSDDTGTPTTLSIVDMGPKFVYSIDKDRKWITEFTYNLISKGSYSANGGSATQLRGTSMKLEFGYVPKVSDTFSFGIKLNYYKATFNEEVVGTTTLSQVTDGRTLIYPSIAILARFE